VVEALDSKSIYSIPEALQKQNVDSLIMKKLKMKPRKKFNKSWLIKIKSAEKYRRKVSVAVVGKYADLKDAYKSIDESLNIAANALRARAEVGYLGAEDKDLLKKIKNFDAVLVPGGFGNRGIEGKIKSIKYARENNIPFLGICLGMQCCVIEASRSLAGLRGANSAEFDKNTRYPVIKMLDGQKNIKYRGGTMRLGNYKSEIKKGTLASRAYGKQYIEERHRHRYEMNPEFVKTLEAAGLFVSAYHKGILPEIVELKTHPFFIGVQFHPEFGSRPMKPHPLFSAFIKAALNKQNS
jgi:CTP synthase